MTTPRKIVLAMSTIVGVLSSDAASAGFRNFGAVVCVGSTAAWHCPFVSDSDTYYGNSSTVLYADFHQVHSTGYVGVTACREYYTGGGWACTAGTTTATTGNQDVQAQSFAYVGGTAYPDDFYFSSIVSVGDDSVDQVYGVSYY